MALQEVRIHQYVLYTRVLVFVYTQTLCMYAHTSHCVHTHITPLAEFTFLTEPFPMEDKDSRYSVNFPGAPMVAFCAKGIAGKKDAGALLLGHLMSHEPCHTLHPIHPAHPPAPPFLHPSFLCIHISRYVYTHMCWVYTREGFVYTPNFICVYTKSRVRVYTKTSFVYTPKHHLCIHQI